MKVSCLLQYDVIHKSNVARDIYCDENAMSSNMMWYMKVILQGISTVMKMSCLLQYDVIHKSNVTRDIYCDESAMSSTI